MTMMLTRMEEIFHREGFWIEVTRNGKALTNMRQLRKSGVLNSYDFKKKAKGTWTVDRWKRDRFEAVNSNYSCNVLKGDGKVAAAQTTLNTVRDSY